MPEPASHRTAIRSDLPQFVEIERDLIILGRCVADTNVQPR